MMKRQAATNMIRVEKGATVAVALRVWNEVNFIPQGSISPTELLPQQLTSYSKPFTYTSSHINT
jgi:hypothetical protein